MLKIIRAFFLCLLLLSCSPEESDPVDPGNSPGQVGQLRRPKKANNKVVAHRGGSMEKKCPDNSIEALNYAIDIGCYASEADVYITKDNHVIVAHTDREDKINGLHPWKATYAQIIAAGKLANGETIPRLEDYLKRVLDAGTIMLWIDIKSIASLPQSEGNEYSSRCAERTSEIVREMKANHFVEFIVGRAEVLKRTINASRGDWSCGYMNTSMSPSSFQQNGYNWANFSISSIFYNNGEVKGNYTIDDYAKNGVRISVYNVDTDNNRAWYISNIDKLYAITTNYPKILLDEIRNN
ncbi:MULTISPECIES: glycerophosphodiester phosphodiesterase [unclassified Proteiniphilum]|jgi:glycerophosphoryl diester phosphodiesterase|uniref:glycerophosphodiester phosphodiesterase n=1 Tax=unclassified Proteiniphilum TaxID=2622718 RepID=UPI0025800C0D|nr:MULTISPECIES: glycerophosphodiester phosphodiesterase family protein [unclassified Proteiniphilum]